MPGNALIARHMRVFFDRLPQEARSSPEQVAQAYGEHLFHRRRRELVDEKRLAQSPFHVGICVDGAEFVHIAKRATLVSDTLLLSHNGLGPARRVCELSRRGTEHPTAIMPLTGDGDRVGTASTSSTSFTLMHESLSMHCPDLSALGAWLTEAEPLLRAGLAWYLPSYTVVRGSSYTYYSSSRHHNYTEPERAVSVPSALDFLVQTGRVVSESDLCPPHPLKSDVVRPVLTMDLPFLEGVGMADFSKITMQEFDAYRSFQSFLRQEFLSLDTALNAIESERELIRIAHHIEDEARGIRSQMATVRRKRAVAVSGAVVGTIGASLVAVYGPAFQAAATALGAAGAGGIWGIIQSAADNSPRTLRDSPWYYVWVLARSSERYQ
ncbi:hypothetical protein AB0O76_42940 [Streptomyces sp. NPDC086554]|uniref:hypothetical protein n=1 Tax=Streptomyces sp. NPDC086554 TaxID=3154864 RepID=UPI00342F55E0